MTREKISIRNMHPERYPRPQTTLEKLRRLQQEQEEVTRKLAEVKEWLRRFRGGFESVRVEN